MKMLFTLLLFAISANYLCAFTLSISGENLCPPSPQIAQEFEVFSVLSCARKCHIYQRCQGICYNFDLNICRISNILLSDASASAVTDQGFSMYWLAHGDGYLRIGTKRYLYVDYAEDIWWARTGCSYSQGTLAVPMNAEESANIISMSPVNQVWLLPERNAAGNWIDLRTGQAINYTAWNAGEPNGGSAESCMTLQQNGLSNDDPCSYKRSYVCEKPL